MYDDGDIFAYFEKTLKERIMILDGAMGTMVQRLKLQQSDYRGEEFKQWEKDLSGNIDMLTVTKPDIIYNIHRQYLEAGADMVETNTFNSTSIMQARYALETYAYRLNKEGAALAKRACQDVYKETGIPRFVCGAIGPTNRTVSRSSTLPSVTFQTLVSAYAEQTRGLLDGGADILLVETIFDTLNAKAALFAIDMVIEEDNRPKMPVIVSAAIADQSGRILSGQTGEAFVATFQHIKPLAIGLNCALNVPQMRPCIQSINRITDTHIICYPSAGLPNTMGQYDVTPQQMALDMEHFAEIGLVNIVGGCCGTTPEHIKAMADICRKLDPRPKSARKENDMILSGREALWVNEATSFLNISQCCHMAGSQNFRSHIMKNEYEQALAMTRRQVENGAQVVQVNFDDILLDGHDAMARFLSMLGSDPVCSRVPVMIDSSEFNAIENGLKYASGKCIISSISLKDGEDEFIYKANIVKRFGAAAVVKAHDETGLATEMERKVGICTRSYRILIDKVGFNPHDIVFDPNVLAIATEQHNNYAVEFIQACREIKTTLAGAKICADISNWSVIFSGMDQVRNALDSVFLTHAVKAGLDMGIIDVCCLALCDDIPKDLLELCEDAVWSRDPDVVKKLSEYAKFHSQVILEAPPF